MSAEQIRSSDSNSFAQLSLTPEQFHAFYTAFTTLRFPLDVAEVLDLRYLINHAVDEFTEPPLTPDYRQFRESLERALDSFNIDNARHHERMLKTLALMRELHVTHSLISRNTEDSLRAAIDHNRLTRRKTVRVGLAYLITGALSVAGWFTLPGVEWMVKLLTVLFALQSWSCFHRVPRIDAQAESLRQQLNDVLRQRVAALNWKTLIHKFALVLGFKQIDGVQVFLSNTDTGDWTAIRTRH
jgi:hypothetical protein